MRIVNCKNGHSFDLDEGAFCPFCGTKYEAPIVKTSNQDISFCPYCGKKVATTGKFCKYCGHRFDDNIELPIKQDTQAVEEQINKMDSVEDALNSFAEEVKNSSVPAACVEEYQEVKKKESSDDNSRQKDNETETDKIVAESNEISSSYMAMTDVEELVVKEAVENNDKFFSDFQVGEDSIERDNAENKQEEVAAIAAAGIEESSETIKNNKIGIDTEREMDEVTAAESAEGAVNNEGSNDEQFIQTVEAFSDKITSLEKTVPEAINGLDPAVGEKTTSHENTNPVVGWIVCIKGNHYGESFVIVSGENSIGSDKSNKIVLDKDADITPENHAVIAYDPCTREFYICPGEAGHKVCVNGKWILEKKQLTERDNIEFGNSEYIFIPLCGLEFCWEDNAFDWNLYCDKVKGMNNADEIYRYLNRLKVKSELLSTNILPKLSDIAAAENRFKSNKKERALELIAEEVEKAERTEQEKGTPVKKEDEVTCPKCGEKMPTGSLFCNRCGEKLQAVENDRIIKEPLTEKPSKAISETPFFELSDKLQKSVEINKSGETVKFYGDRVVFDYKTIPYEKIAAMSIFALKKSQQISLYVDSSFHGELKMTMIDGSKDKIKVTGRNIYGIGNKKGAQERFHELFSAVYNYMAKAMAAVMLNQIYSGSTVEIYNVTFTRDKASFLYGLRRNLIEVTKDNFGQCSLDGDVIILDKHGNMMARFNASETNALLLPYVFNTLFK